MPTMKKTYIFLNIYLFILSDRHVFYYTKDFTTHSLQCIISFLNKKGYCLRIAKSTKAKKDDRPPRIETLTLNETLYDEKVL